MEETESSDLDICLIVMRKSKKLDETIEALSRHLGDTYRVVVEAVVVTKKEYYDKKNKLVFKDISSEGIWLKGNSKMILYEHKKKNKNN
ncbi:MAG: hypothetical protein HRT90_07680 [Candidatus Margulisbacteria bacterium]|nr:hypothetical protein [Candidatus Margulisiibacteriota bacterium]